MLEWLRITQQTDLEGLDDSRRAMVFRSHCKSEAWRNWVLMAMQEFSNGDSSSRIGKKQDSELPSEIGNSRAFPQVPFILAATGR